MSERIEVGDLRPFRDLALELAAWDQVDRKRARRDSQLARIRAMLDDALAKAANPHVAAGMRPSEFAALHGISVSAVYKRLARGKNAPPSRRKGSRIIIEANAA
jgi:hypothetical protein